jgi:hypothetical protein
MALLRAVYRFARCRAATRDEMQWAARMIDGLSVTLEAVRRDNGRDERG